jgi:hypothetical protein
MSKFIPIACLALPGTDMHLLPLPTTRRTAIPSGIRYEMKM